MDRMYEEILTPNWKFLNDGQNNISILGPGGHLQIYLFHWPRWEVFQLNFDPIALNTTWCINFPLSYIGPPPLQNFLLLRIIAYPIASAAPVPNPPPCFFSDLVDGLAGYGRKKLE